MTLLITLIFALIGVPLTPETAPTTELDIEDGTYSINIDESQIEWKAYKVGGQHNGVVNIETGELKFKDNQLVSGTITVDMKSIKVLDLEGEWKTKLENHLNSPDFFNTKEYPKAVFEITEAFPVGTSGRYRVKGDLTIKEDTHPVSFNAQLDDKGNLVMAQADVTIDRAKYNVRYGSGSFFDNLGDKTIYDEFDLSIALKVNK
jgi:polyisoprenoid-binding protein YceI